MSKFNNPISLILYLSISIFLSSKIIAKDIPIGHLVDFTGPTSSVGKPWGEGFIDTIKWINKSGGINKPPAAAQQNIISMFLLH